MKLWNHYVTTHIGWGAFRMDGLILINTHTLLEIVFGHIGLILLIKIIPCCSQFVAYVKWKHLTSIMVKRNTA